MEAPVSAGTRDLNAQVIQWCDAAYKQASAEAAQNPALKIQSKIIQYLDGQQWPSKPTAYGTSRPVNNKMFRLYWEAVGLLTDGKPEPNISVYDKQNDYSEIQSVLNQLLAFWAEQPCYAEWMRSIVGWGLIGRCFAKVQWNGALNGGLGDVEVIPMAPGQVLCLGGKGTIDTAELVIESEQVTIASLKRRYGKLADGIKPDVQSSMNFAEPMRPSGVSKHEWGRYSPQLKGLVSRNMKSGDGESDDIFPKVWRRTFWFWDGSINETNQTIHVGPSSYDKVIWVKGEKTIKNIPAPEWSYDVEPGQPLYPRGRVIVKAANVMLEDSCVPYYHPGLPYVEFVPLAAPWQPSGLSLMGNLLGPQDIINRIIAGLLETIKASLVPTVIMPKNSVSQSDLDNFRASSSGGKMEYSALANRPPEFRKPPEIPTLAMQFLEMTGKEMDQTSVGGGINQALGKEQIPGGDTLDKIASSRATIVRVMGRSLELFLSKAGSRVLSCMLQFYTVAHRVAILGEKGIVGNDFAPVYGSLMPQGMAPEDFIRKFQFRIKPGSALSYEREKKIQMASMLHSRGVLSTENLFRALDANIDMAQNKQEIVAEAALRAQLAAAAGQGKPKGKK